MPFIRSPNPDFDRNNTPTVNPNYSHGVDSRRSFVPMAFQVTSPVNTRLALLPHSLVMHINPQSLSESHAKKIERIQTKGGFVEQHWPDELSELSAEGTTGAFMNIYTGLTSVMRQKTIAWDRYRDLYDLYRNNGAVYDPFGNVVLQGHIMVMYDRGVYLGKFRNFSVNETDDSPFAFKVNWTFKVEETILKLPNLGGALGPGFRPGFQSTNHGKPKPIQANPALADRLLAGSQPPQLTAVEAANQRAARGRE